MTNDGKAAMGPMVENPRLTLPTRADLSTQDLALNSNSLTLQLSSTPSNPNSSPEVESDNLSSTPSDPNSSPQVGSDTLSPPPSIRRRSSKARTGSSDLEYLALYS